MQLLDPRKCKQFSKIFSPYLTAADDGYTGTNFNRPDFKRMMEDVEAGYVKTIIVAKLNSKEKDRDTFVYAIRKFMQMETLTPHLLHELIDHIDVYETQGTGKNRTQRIVIYYRFVGYIELPISIEECYSAETRQGVAVTYISKESA